MTLIASYLGLFGLGLLLVFINDQLRGRRTHRLIEDMREIHGVMTDAELDADTARMWNQIQDAIKEEGGRS